MNLTKWTASALTAFLIASAPAFAGDHDKDKHSDSGHHSQISRYDFEVAPGNVMIFREPVSFTGEVIAVSDSHRTLRAANGMTIMVPNQALVWNGDTQMFGQSALMGDEVVVHMRSEEPYRIMNAPTVAAPMMAIGSYDGVFYLSNDFVADLDLDNLDNNIYAEYDREKANRVYDVDLASVRNDNDM